MNDEINKQIKHTEQYHINLDSSASEDLEDSKRTTESGMDLIKKDKNKKITNSILKLSDN